MVKTEALREKIDEREESKGDKQRKAAARKSLGSAVLGTPDDTGHEAVVRRKREDDDKTSVEKPAKEGDKRKAREGLEVGGQDSRDLLEETSDEDLRRRRTIARRYNDQLSQELDSDADLGEAKKTHKRNKEDKERARDRAKTRRDHWEKIYNDNDTIANDPSKGTTVRAQAAKERDKAFEALQQAEDDLIATERELQDVSDLSPDHNSYYVEGTLKGLRRDIRKLPAAEQREVILDFIRRHAAEAYLREGAGSFSVQDFVEENYYRDYATDPSATIVEDLGISDADIQSAVRDVADPGNVDQSHFAQARQEYLDLVDSGMSHAEAAARVIEDFDLKAGSRPGAENEARVYLDAATTLEIQLAGGGMLVEVLCAPTGNGVGEISLERKLEYATTHTTFNPDTFAVDVASLYRLREEVRATGVADDIATVEEMVAKLYEQAAEQAASGRNNIRTLDELLADAEALRDPTLRGELPEEIQDLYAEFDRLTGATRVGNYDTEFGDTLEEEYQNLRAAQIFEDVLADLESGRISLSDLPAVLDEYEDEGEIDPQHRLEIEAYATEGAVALGTRTPDQYLTDELTYQGHQRRMQTAYNQAKLEIQNMTGISNELKAAKIMELDALKMLNDNENDTVSQIFTQWEKTLLKLRKWRVEYSRLIATGLIIAAAGSGGTGVVLLLSGGVSTTSVALIVGGGAAAAASWKTNGLARGWGEAYAKDVQKYTQRTTTKDKMMKASLAYDIRHNSTTGNELTPEQAAIAARQVGLDPAIVRQMDSPGSLFKLMVQDIGQSRAAIAA